MYERSTGTTRRVSSGPNSNGPFDAFLQGTSRDGSRVFFVTSEPIVAGDTDTASDIFERSGGTTTLVSAGAINGNGSHGAGYSGASANGKRVFFFTTEQLSTGDTDAVFDIYERSNGTTKLVSVGGASNSTFHSWFAGASADGSRVYFHTSEPFVSIDGDVMQDVYEQIGWHDQAGVDHRFSGELASQRDLRRRIC